MESAGRTHVNHMATNIRKSVASGSGCCAASAKTANRKNIFSQAGARVRLAFCVQMLPGHCEDRKDRLSLLRIRISFSGSVCLCAYFSRTIRGCY